MNENNIHTNINWNDLVTFTNSTHCDHRRCFHSQPLITTFQTRFGWSCITAVRSSLHCCSCFHSHLLHQRCLWPSLCSLESCHRATTARRNDLVFTRINRCDIIWICWHIRLRPRQEMLRTNSISITWFPRFTWFWRQTKESHVGSFTTDRNERQNRYYADYYSLSHNMTLPSYILLWM